MSRRQRTGTEGKELQKKRKCQYPSTPLTLSDFLCNATEKKVQMDLQSEMNAYMIHRVALNNSSFQHPFLGLQDYNSLTRATHTEESHVIYLEVLDAVADCKDTMMTLLHSLRSRFIEQRNMIWLVLEGYANFMKY